MLVRFALRDDGLRQASTTELPVLGNVHVATMGTNHISKLKHCECSFAFFALFRAFLELFSTTSLLSAYLHFFTFSSLFLHLPICPSDTNRTESHITSDNSRKVT